MKNVCARQFPLFTLLLTLCLMSIQARSQDQAVLTPRQRTQLFYRAGEATSVSKPSNHAPSVPYVVIDYPGSTSTLVYGLNNSGDIVGGYAVNGQGYGFLYSGGKFRSLNPPGGTSTEANGINDSGDIVGTYQPNGAVKAEVFLLKAGAYSKIVYPDAKNTFAAGINNAGDIDGNYDDQSNTQHGFLYSGGVYSDIDPPGSVQTLVGGINSLGEIVGVYCVSPCTTFQAFTYVGGTYRNLNLPSLVQLFGVNTEGDIVGNSPSSGGTEDLFYIAATQTFVPFDIDGASDTSAEGINDNCAIVGYYVDPTTSSFNGYYVRSSSCQ